MAKDIAQKYEESKQRIENRRDTFKDPKDADRILQMADAYDETNVIESPPEGQNTKSKTTLKNYLVGLDKTAKRVSLTEATGREINMVMQRIFDGDDPNTKDSGLTSGSVRVYQNAVRQFLCYHTDSTADPDEITLFDTNKPKVDPEDMLTRDEIHDLRTAANCMRDKALIDFLLYTGQRNTATRTLRIQDLDLEKGRFKLNDSINGEGLKDAGENGKWRDLLLSVASIRQYLETEHPDPENPDAYVFTGRPSFTNVNPEEQLKGATISEIIGKIADRAGEENPSIRAKPTHPHALRHNFVTIALRRGMKESAIKHQIGHKPDSQIMESTYAHLQDSDHINAARDAFDLETEDSPGELTPEVCPRCSTAVPDKANLCHVCGLEFTPGSAEKAQEIDDDTHDSATEAETTDDRDAVSQLRDLLKEHPELKDQLLDD